MQQFEERPDITISRPKTAGLILAGGRASRLGGGAKGAIMLKGMPLAALVQNILAVAATPVGINTLPDLALAYTGLGTQIVYDAPEFAERGPLAGVLAGLEWAQTLGAINLITAPCDAPFLPKSMGETLLGALGDPDEAAIAVTPEGEHPLCAVWSVALAPRLRTYLLDPGADLAVRAFQSRVRTARAIFQHEADFLNINTPEDLAIAQSRLV